MDAASLVEPRWFPGGVKALKAPPDPIGDSTHLWRPARLLPDVPTDSAARTLKAISDQRAFKRFPGYTGCAPGPGPAPLPPREDAVPATATESMTAEKAAAKSTATTFTP